MTRILFIDDDVLALQLMSKVTNLLGYKAITSTSPNRALDLVKCEKPNLIMVDMLMDEMDGPEFVRMIRELPEIGQVPVLIFSAGTGYSDEETARMAGANGFLHKPVGIKELTQAVNTYAVQG
jgi:CheY-like chemotaxis protein